MQGERVTLPEAFVQGKSHYPAVLPTARHRRSPIVFPRAPRVTGGEQTNFMLRRLVLMSPSLGRHPEREEVKPTRRPLLDLEPASALLRPYFPGLITVTIKPAFALSAEMHNIYD